MCAISKYTLFNHPSHLNLMEIYSLVSKHIFKTMLSLLVLLTKVVVSWCICLREIPSQIEVAPPRTQKL